MNLEELKAEYDSKRGEKRANPFGLRKKVYQEQYPLIRDAVKAGMDLLTLIKIMREKEGHFKGLTDLAVHQAFNRALKAEGINLKRGRKRPELKKK